MRKGRHVFLGLGLSIIIVYLLLSLRVKKPLRCLPFEELVLEKVSMNDECLIDQIRQSKLFPPSKLPYNFTTRIDQFRSKYDGFDAIQSFSKDMDAPWVEALIAVEAFVPKVGQRNFLECGALDGITFSTTLHLERFLNWTGVLIEADDRFYNDMKHANRKAYGIHACASRRKHPSMVYFKPSPIYIPSNWKGKKITRYRPIVRNRERMGRGGLAFLVKDHFVAKIKEDLSVWIEVVNPGIGQIPNDLKSDEIKAKTDLIVVPCVPVYSILLAVNITRIDLFILDVEGVEFDILETIPFDKIHIAVFMIEVYGKPEQEIKKIHELMHFRGYTFYDRFRGGMHPGDDIFIRTEYLKNNENWKILKKLNIKDIYKIITGKEETDVTKSDIEYFSKLSFPLWGIQPGQR